MKKYFVLLAILSATHAAAKDGGGREGHGGLVIVNGSQVLLKELSPQSTACEIISPRTMQAAMPPEIEARLGHLRTTGVYPKGLTFAEILRRDLDSITGVCLADLSLKTYENPLERGYLESSRAYETVSTRIREADGAEWIVINRAQYQKYTPRQKAAIWYSNIVGDWLPRRGALAFVKAGGILRLLVDELGGALVLRLGRLHADCLFVLFAGVETGI